MLISAPSFFVSMSIDDILYSPVAKRGKSESHNYEHDWDIGAQLCRRCNLDLMDYLAYGFCCKKKQED